MMFRDRAHAAELLADRLAPYRGRNALVLAIPRGGVPMGRAIADALDAEFDVVLVHKLGAPGRPELAIGAVDESGAVFVGDEAIELRVSGDDFEAERRRQLAVLHARRRAYTPGRTSISPRGRVVLVVDDGMATGSTMIAALRAVRRRRPAELVAVAAVMPAEVVDRMEREADRVVCLHAPDWFGAVGAFFEDFGQVDDDEVIAALSAPRAPQGSSP